METIGTARETNVDVAILDQQDTASVVLPSISASAASVVEGQSGVRTVSIPVTLSAPTPVQVAVTWSTANGTAVAPGDYAISSGTVTFAAGETTNYIAVPVKGDNQVEVNESVRVVLSDPVNSTLGSDAVAATIVDDDRLVVETDSLPTGKAGRAYAATLTASGGTGPYRWTKLAKLPRGLRLNARTGIISGTPKKAGTFLIAVQVIDESKARQNATKTIALTIG
jgi:chitinase